MCSQNELQCLISCNIFDGMKYENMTRYLFLKEKYTQINLTVKIKNKTI